MTTFAHPRTAWIGVFAVFLADRGATAQPVPDAVPITATAHGVSHELAQWRANTVSDVRYTLQLDVTALDSAVGRVKVRFLRRGSADAIIDYRGRRLTRAVANGMAVGLANFNGRHLRIPASALVPGENSVDLEFVSEIATTGASIIHSHDNDGSDYLYTLLVPADANQLFPCFDQPDLKARVTLALTTPAAWTALANGSLVRIDSTVGRTAHHFTETKPLSTYLIAFAAGPWQHASSTVGGRTINAYFRRSRTKEVDADTILALTHRALGWMEQYFSRPYPFEKFDVMLSPAFPFGGMEHPGLVMFNEDRFIFRERPTLPRRLGRFSTILHEVAHMWFGDLVTMRWFDDLWLKEGFATYMAAKALADLEPSSDAWKTFYQSNRPAAYGVDQTAGTTPLWQEMANLDQAKSAYGAIVYNKAPAVLKQLNYTVGEQAFRAGVRQFLADHAFANATWPQLLGAVEKAASRSMQPFGRNFMLRAGMPVVEQRLATRNGKITSLTLVQHPAQAMSGTAAWPMRTQLLLWYADQAPVTIPVVLNGHSTDVVRARGRATPQFVFANYQDYGYFLTILDSASVHALESGGMRFVSDSFLRSMLWGALWDLVRDAQMSPAEFAGLVLVELPNERDEQLVPALLSRLERALRAYLADDVREKVRADAERVLWNGAHDAARTYGIRKSFLDAFVAVAATAEGVSRLESLFAADSAAGEPVQDPTRWEVVQRLAVLDVEGADGLLAAQTRRDSSPDGRARAFAVQAGRKSADVKRDYFSRYFADRSLNEDWVSRSLGAFNALEHERLTLPYVRPALDSLAFIQANRRIFFLGGWLGAFFNGQRSEAALEAARTFLADRPDLPNDLRQKVLQYVDELDRTVRIRRRWR